VVSDAPPVRSDAPPIASDAPPTASDAPRTAAPTLAFRVDLVPPLVVQPVGGLAPLAIAGGMRAFVGPGRGPLAGLFGGISLFGATDAAVSGRGPAHGAWRTAMARVHVDVAYEIVEVPLGPAALGVGVSAGAGVAVGSHVFTLGSLTDVKALFGPSCVASLDGLIALGPGALVLGVPVGVVVDLAGATARYAPVSLGVLIGYRLSL
jgi:hypothetical protein